MNNLDNGSSSYDESQLTPGYYYTIGTNDGIQFKWCRYHGTKLLNGKAIFVYSTKDGLQLTINPSYHVFTMEEEGQFPMPEDFNNNKGEEENG